ncbi:DUF397 domain-containing protein [Streptomyces caatingaensis]|uniref:Toxin-antitoxin system toxin subunit n=1 Tax=Streptomyces caatingaensis TaxID=1678637 RepID=A0A0K9XL37_9ACTN|nr:DUF397 domain-containing protein [Streptomyces caatingaensis]KNB53392.1 toxin-antitoxin system toxin subunit [Streptomyces caatingaensis]
MRTPLDLTEADWVKSSYSSGEGGMCLEWAPGLAEHGTIPIRDSKRPQGPSLTFSSSPWHSFITELNAGG